VKQISELGKVLRKDNPVSGLDAKFRNIRCKFQSLSETSRKGVKLQSLMGNLSKECQVLELDRKHVSKLAGRFVCSTIWNFKRTLGRPLAKATP